MAAFLFHTITQSKTTKINEINFFVKPKAAKGEMVGFRDKGAARVCRACEAALCSNPIFKQRRPHPVHCRHFQRKNRTWCKKRLHGGWASRDSLPAKPTPTTLLLHMNWLPECRHVFCDHQRVIGRLVHRAP